MIERYTSAHMRKLWSDEVKFQRWTMFEKQVLVAQVELGLVPSEVLRGCLLADPPTPGQVTRHEERTRHDVLGFLSALAENTPERADASWFHHGMTSSDLVDSVLHRTLFDSGCIIGDQIDALIQTLKRSFSEHLETFRVGRTHGMHAEATTWGHRLAEFATAFHRVAVRLDQARNEVNVIQVSGPVGTYSTVDPQVEQRVAAWFGAEPAGVCSQIIGRDRIAHFASVLAQVAGICEQVALEVRHGQRSEVRELAEGFAPGQRGSSAMPHKKNPISAENICGLARVARGYLVPILESVATWHERDISHSSVERTALVDLVCLIDYLVIRTRELVQNLFVDVERMGENLRSAGDLIYTSRVLLVLTSHGMDRETLAYPLVQKAAGLLLDGHETRLEMALQQCAWEMGIEVVEEVWNDVRLTASPVTRTPDLVQSLVYSLPDVSVPVILPRE